MRPATPDATLPALRMVGLGASAGGLKPLEQFLSQVPLGTGLAFLVVQHLDPTHETLLAEQIGRAHV